MRREDKWKEDSWEKIKRICKRKKIIPTIKVVKANVRVATWWERSLEETIAQIVKNIRKRKNKG